MKKDLLNNGAKLMGMLFLFFFSFTVSDLSAQTDVSPALKSLMHDGVRYDVNGLLSQYNYVSETTASDVFKAEAVSYSNLAQSTGDDFQQIEANFKSHFYKTLYYNVADGAPVEDALRNSAFNLQDMLNTAYSGYGSTVPRPDLIAVITEAVQKVAL